MLEAAPQVTRLQDYQPPAWLVPNIELDIDIRAESTTVRANLSVVRNPESAGDAPPFELDGDDLEHLTVSIDGRALGSDEYSVSASKLEIARPPERFELTTAVRVDPDNNTQLMGLYRSSDGYFTQCEAEGFRRITWFPDRPDVMSRYITTIHADADAFPLLLSNGNFDAEGQEDGNRHWARWLDPFPKP